MFKKLARRRSVQATLLGMWKILKDPESSGSFL